MRSQKTQTIERQASLSSNAREGPNGKAAQPVSRAGACILLPSRLNPCPYGHGTDGSLNINSDISIDGNSGYAGEGAIFFAGNSIDFAGTVTSNGLDDPGAPQP